MSRLARIYRKLLSVCGTIKNYIDESVSITINKVSAQVAVYFMVIVTFVVGGLAPMAISIWSIVLVVDGDNQLVFGDPFTLAQVIAIFAGFGLFAGFSSTVSATLRRSLRWMANLYLLSAVSFVMLGLFLPALSTADGEVQSSNVVVGIVAICILLGSLMFSMGTFVRALHIPSLLENGETNEES